LTCAAAIASQRPRQNRTTEQYRQTKALSFAHWRREPASAHGRPARRQACFHIATGSSACYIAVRPPRRKRGVTLRNAIPDGRFSAKLHTRSRGTVARHHDLRIAMRISARNQFKGKILEVKKGATTAHVRLEIAPGQVITSSITNDAVEELGLKAGGTAIAIIKASNVMIAVD
jgi:molybdopterin-binding protein